MKVLFLDIDGVVNCTATSRRRVRGLMPIEPRLARIVQGIAQAIPDLKIVLSSSWREAKAGRAVIEDKVAPCFDITPVFDEADDVRGYEIQAWLELHPGVTRYAIVDDNCDILNHQRPHFFRTSSKTGITKELADKIVAHLNR
jgi:hypothetical protein